RRAPCRRSHRGLTAHTLARTRRRVPSHKGERMHTHALHTRRLALVLALLALGVESGHAAGLGIPLDGFLTTWTAWVVGLGFALFITGLAGWAGEKFNTPYQPMLAGAMSFFTTAGLLGGGTVIAGLMGLAVGAMLPL